MRPIGLPEAERKLIELTPVWRKAEILPALKDFI